ncbi:hypothetical protein F1B92_04455 [Campylobacter sp. FMV-PI01]|uniref:Uncharacterized protein n=1 Tax=Campylobacter portucalensis TaxID=2608384 RepID=A0A6L5WKR1_9BACT|nr:hypothetical protein [Campylobacter portucalensis]MSN96433.1 hypothetical protein [Campylobacter portucalensis]
MEKRYRWKKEDVSSLHFPVYFNKENNEIIIDDEITNVTNKGDYIKIIPYQTKVVLGRWTWAKQTMREKKRIFDG